MSAYSNPDEQGPPGPPPGPIPLTRTNGPPQTAEERQRAANSRADFRKYGYMPPLITPYNPANPYASNNEVGGRRKKKCSSRHKTRKHRSSRRKTRKHRSNKSRRSRK